MSKTETSESRKVNVLVLGDVNSDTVLYRIPETSHRDSFDNRPRSYFQDNSERNSRYKKTVRPGGAFLLHEIIEEVLQEKSKDQEETDVKVIGYKNCAQFDLNKCPESVTVLELFPKDEKGSERVYRIDKTYGEITNLNSVHINAEILDSLYQELNTSPDCENLIIINDKGLGFCEFNYQSWLSKFNKLNVLINLNNCSDSLESELWKTIIEDEKLRDNTIVVITASALRSAGVLIRVESSLEKTADDLKHSMKQKVLKQLMLCRHLVISFDNFDVVHWNRDNRTTAFSYFCPFINKNITTDKLKRQMKLYGRMAGYRTVLLAALANALAKAIKSEKELLEALPVGITEGVRLCKKHFLEGFAKEGFDKEQSEPYPFKELFSEKTIDEIKEIPFVIAPLKLDYNPDWNRISDIRDECGDQNTFEELLINIVISGLQKVSVEPLNSRKSHSERNMLSIPYAAFGKLLTADKQEIDQFLSVYLLMQKYLEDKTWKTPLCLAVFGPPGSGKSFTIKQIMKSVQQSGTKNPLIYNLSQFMGIDDLTTAFHQAQDRALAEEVPLIIFDEFDSRFDKQELGWLKYFLEPMQDGTFRARGNTYLVGRAIFVFAGGVNESFTELDSKKNIQKYKDAKLPDFISRLRGHLDIMGIDSNARKLNNELMFRRAVILRGILEERAKGIFHLERKTASIDREVIMAFLKIPSYKHGTRSMEAIIQMSLPDKGKVMSSSLPTKEQLNMHVNADEFLGLMREASEHMK